LRSFDELATLSAIGESCKTFNNPGGFMPTISNIVHQLETQRKLTQRELEKLDLAIKALTSLEGESVVATAGTRRKPHFSAAARERIAAAQRARWKKLKAAQKK
jgi:hypothetical protein